MARKRMRAEKRDTSRDHYPSPYTTNRMHSPLVIRVRPIDLSVFDDRRTYHPAGYHRPAKKLGGMPVQRLVEAGRMAKRLSSPLSPFLRFPDAKKVIKCVRRKERREVIIAKKLQRKGAGGAKSFDLWSKVRC